MAIIHEGRILLEAEPLRAVEELTGRIWRRVVTTEELERLDREHAVISTRLLAGRTIAHVFAETSPDADFQAVEPDLKDVYFSVMAERHGGRVNPAPAAGGRRYAPSSANTRSMGSSTPLHAGVIRSSWRAWCRR